MNLPPANNIARLHYLTQDLKDKSHAMQAELACTGGANWVQLRSKGQSPDTWEQIAREVKVVTDRYKARLIINDNVQLAKKIEAAGVHLGKEDMSPAEAREILGEKYIIGGTVNNLEDMKRVASQPINYIGLGPYRFTSTKEKLANVLDAEKLQELIQFQNTYAIVLIGGIQAGDIKEIALLGAYGVAVSSAINLATDASKATSTFLFEINQAFAL